MKLTAAVLCWLTLALTLSAFGQETIQATALGNKTTVIENAAKVQREVFDAAKHPALSAVGRINFAGGSWCSIILVDEDVAVTAGHCFWKANVKFDLRKDFQPEWTSVNFKPDGIGRIENVSVKRVLTAKMNPDYAIVLLNKKIPASLIKPLKISNLTFDELRADESRLGCAGFNGDKELGGGGRLMTISRNIRIIPETSSQKRVDANCFSTYGGSGGLFFREPREAEENTGGYDFLGVIWGLTDEKLNEKGEVVRLDEVITSITPVSAFYEELTAFIKKNREQAKWRKAN
ncbi:MAG TPA: hypothetical protein VIL74_16145 [Pyrinomonadaceae bacterium]|jgi:hypothetical protein